LRAAAFNGVVARQRVDVALSPLLVIESASAVPETKALSLVLSITLTINLLLSQKQKPSK